MVFNFCKRGSEKERRQDKNDLLMDLVKCYKVL